MSVKTAVMSVSPYWLRQYAERIEASPLGHRLANGVFWSLAGAVISRGLTLVSSIIAARILGKEAFGELGIIQSTIGMFGIFAGFGLGMTATKYVAEFRNSDPEKTGRILTLSNVVSALSSGVMGLVLFFCASWLATHTLAAPHLSKLLRIGAGLLFLSGLNGAQTGALAGFEAFKTIAKINLYSGFASFPLIVGGVCIGGIEGAVWGLVGSIGVNWILNHFALKKEARLSGVPLSSNKWLRELPVIWHFSFPAVLGSILLAPVNWACGALLVNHQSDGYGEMGIFNAARQWQLAILFIPGILGQVVLPLLSNLSAKSEVLQYRKILKFNILLNGGIALIVVIPLVFFASHIMTVYGPGFERGPNVLRVLALSAVLVAVNNVIGQGIASKNKMWTGFVFNALWAMILLITTWMFIRLGFGAIGLAYSTFLAYVFHTCWQGVYLSREK